MPDFSPGQILRRLRKQRGLTLKEAATLLNSSAPVLSRKERGQEAVERLDIRLAIAAYELSPWEAYTLWTEAGFIPEPTLPPAQQYDLRQFAESLLLRVAFPAFILDTLGFVRAWNQGIEAIWRPSESQNERIHIIDDLFSPRLRQHLAERWDPYVVQAMKVFYHKTLRVANDPAFRDLIGHMIRAHGADFVAKWNQAQESASGPPPLPPIDMGATVVPYDSPCGPIDYLVMQTTFHFPQEHDLIMYVPYGKPSQERFEQLKATLGGNRLYFSEVLS